jgi:hypothetical protein
MAVEAFDQNVGDGLGLLLRLPEPLGRCSLLIEEQGGNPLVLFFKVPFPPFRDPLAEGLPVRFKGFDH